MLSALGWNRDDFKEYSAEVSFHECIGRKNQAEYGACTSISFQIRLVNTLYTSTQLSEQ